MAQGGRPRIRPEYEMRIAQLAQIPGTTIESIFTTLRDEAVRDNQKAPSLQTVKGRVAKLRKGTKQQSFLEEDFHWPESMREPSAAEIDGPIVPHLPWEAGRDALDLLGHRLRRGDPWPSNRAVLWFHRISEVAREAPIDVRDRIAKALELWDFVQSDAPRRQICAVEPAVELLLAIRGWELPEWSETFEQMLLLSKHSPTAGELIPEATYTRLLAYLGTSVTKEVVPRQRMREMRQKLLEKTGHGGAPDANVKS